MSKDDELFTDGYSAPMCFTCAHCCHDILKRENVCRATGETIGGNFETFRPRDCESYKRG